MQVFVASSAVAAATLVIYLGILLVTGPLAVGCQDIGVCILHVRGVISVLNVYLATMASSLVRGGGDRIWSYGALLSYNSDLVGRGMVLI